MDQSDPWLPFAIPSDAGAADRARPTLPTESSRPVRPFLLRARGFAVESAVRVRVEGEGPKFLRQGA